MTAIHDRQLIASEAARLLYEEGYRDYYLAKQKAAQRLGCSANKSNQPSNLEVHNALLKRRQTLATEKENIHLVEIRKVALEAMDFLQRYSPMLVGAVMDGTAGSHSPATLHLFANTVEEVMFFLEDNKIPFQTHEQSFRIRGKQEAYPLLRFYADDYEIELIIFEEGSPAPLSSITGKAMKRLSIDGVKELA